MGCLTWWVEGTRGALTCSSAAHGSPSISRSLFRSKFWGKHSEWQIFSVRRFLLEKRMRWMVNVWGRWVSVKTWKKQSHRGDESQAFETGQFRETPGPTVCSSSKKEGSGMESHGKGPTCWICWASHRRLKKPRAPPRNPEELRGLLPSQGSLVLRGKQPPLLCLPPSVSVMGSKERIHSPGSHKPQDPQPEGIPSLSGRPPRVTPDGPEAFGLGASTCFQQVFFSQFPQKHLSALDSSLGWKKQRRASSCPRGAKERQGYFLLGTTPHPADELIKLLSLFSPGPLTSSPAWYMCQGLRKDLRFGGSSEDKGP